MPVNPLLQTAVNGASDDLLLTAGANRLGFNQRTAWPPLKLGSNVGQDKGLAYAESFYNLTNPPANVVEDLADYLEISTWSHVFDGWRYLSQSANALLHASRGKALHLAYYAELRAAMCILACSGIAILNNKHYAIAANGSLMWFNGGTHGATWNALTEWSKNQHNALSVVKSLKIDEYMNIQWLELCRTSHSPAIVASNWLQNWSIDLSIATNDRDARNEASYRPNLSSDGMLPLHHRDIIAVMNASYSSLHGESEGFSQVQAALVADFCAKSADFRFGGYASKNEQFWRSSLRWLTTQNGMSDEEAKEVVTYIRSIENTPGGHLLSLTDPAKTDTYSVFSRAFFMLHLASAMTLNHRDKMNLRAVGGKANWPDQIVKQYGLQAGIWETGKISTDIVAIESDAEAAYDTLARELPARKAAICQKKFWTNNAHPLTELCNFERHFVAMASTV